MSKTTFGDKKTWWNSFLRFFSLFMALVLWYSGALAVSPEVLEQIRF